MKRVTLWGVMLVSVVAFFASSCAKDVDEDLVTTQKRIFKAYIDVNGYSGCETIGDSIYVISRSGEGVGEYPADSTYAFVRYSAKYTNGDYAAYSYDTIAMQMGTYKPTNFYGSYVWPINMGYISDPISDVVKTMKPGEKSVSIVPPWLTTINTETAYASTSAPLIYEIELEKVVKDIYQYQYNVLQQFSTEHFGSMDSLSLGFYFKKFHSSGYKDTIAEGNTIYLWYVGRMLDGSVFDTNIEDTAKKYDLYDPTRSYTEMSVMYSKDPETIEEEEDLVAGFCKGLVSGNLTYGDKCFIFFDSSLGYGSAGSLDNGEGIPPFYPISFEIWVNEYEAK